LIIVIMGVAGSGKTTIGSLLAQQLGWQFADADSFHSAENIERIRQGIALTDEKRAPWLHAIREAMLQWVAEKRSVVLACSLLKRIYREQLYHGPEAKLVYLKGDYKLIYERLSQRKGHFAGSDLLASQFETLEEPSDAITVDVNRTPEEIVTEIRGKLGLAYNHLAPS
jgi:gluconokinase